MTSTAGLSLVPGRAFIMARNFSLRFYKSAAWQSCRDGYIQHRQAVDGGLCERCHDQPGYICHHTIWLTPQNITDPTIVLNWDNLEYVCKDCHDAEHLPTHQARPLLCGFDEKGRPIKNADPEVCSENEKDQGSGRI